MHDLQREVLVHEADDGGVDVDALVGLHELAVRLDLALVAVGDVKLGVEVGVGAVVLELEADLGVVVHGRVQEDADLEVTAAADGRFKLVLFTLQGQDGGAREVLQRHQAQLVAEDGDVVGQTQRHLRIVDTSVLRVSHRQLDLAQTNGRRVLDVGVHVHHVPDVHHAGDDDRLGVHGGAGEGHGHVVVHDGSGHDVVKGRHANP